jgi:AraC-like DNA-binding protein
LAYDLRLLVQRVEDNLATRPRMPISDMARQLKVERHTIERAVRKGTGRTFRALRAERLLTEALVLLAAEPTRSIKEASFLLGYSSPRAFRRFLKQTCGRSPKEARVTIPVAPRDRHLTGLSGESLSRPHNHRS